jgi:Sigma-70, region 4
MRVLYASPTAHLNAGYIRCTLIQSIAAGDIGAMRIFFARQKIEILPKGPTQLSTTHREIIDLVYYHQRSIEEVAEIIGVPPSTVKTRMFCARKRTPELSSPPAGLRLSRRASW